MFAHNNCNFVELQHLLQTKLLYIKSELCILVVNSGIETELQIISQNFKLFKNCVASLKFNTLHS